MGKKKIHPAEPQWDNSAEQEIFGSQSPFAADTPSNENTPLPPQQPHKQQYPPATSSTSSTNNDPAPTAPPVDQPFIFPHYPTQQPYLASPYSQQSRPNKGAFKNAIVPEDAPPMYTKEPAPVVPPPAPVLIAPPIATAPASPSSATASAPPSIHPNPHPQHQTHPQESLPRVVPGQTQQAPFYHSQSPVLQQPSVPPSEQTPLSPQFYSPTTPTSPRLDRPPPPLPQTALASYGAIRPSHPRSSRSRAPSTRTHSDSESNNSSEDEEERMAAGERRRRRKAIKKHLSGCTCNKICWFLIFIVLLSFWTSPIEKTIKDPCTLMAERRLEPDIDSYSIGKASHLNISLDIMEHILGDIKVSESDDWVQEHVLIWVNTTFSHPDLQDVIDFKIIHDSLFKNPILRAGLNSTDPTERERHVKLMKNHCARIDVEFIFPKYSGNNLRLFARTHKGDIRVRTDGPTLVFKELHLETQVGDVFFEAGTVQTSTSIKTGRGKVQGTVKTLEQVEVTTTTGDIALRVDTKPGYHGSDTNNLNITLQSTKSSIDLELVRQYNGWFSLMSGIDRPTFDLSPDYKDFIRLSSSTATSLSGWVWDGFSSRKDLPSVSAKASSGTVHAQVLSKPKK